MVPVIFLPMALDLRRRHPARAQRRDLAVEAGEAGLVLGHQLRQEGAVAIPEHRDPRPRPNSPLIFFWVAPLREFPLPPPTGSCFA